MPRPPKKRTICLELKTAYFKPLGITPEELSEIVLEVDELEHLWQSERHPLIVVREVPDTARFGKVEICDGRISAFLEKGTHGPGLINAGCYVLPKTALDDFPLGKPFSIETEFFAKFLQHVKFSGYVTNGRFIDIGVPEDYKLAQTALVSL